MSKLQLMTFALAGFLVAGHASATTCLPNGNASNCAPPPGAILDFAGMPLPHNDYQPYSVSFVATGATTNITFAFRDDPSFIYLDDVSVTTGGGLNLLSNGGFEDGPLNANAPALWTFLTFDAAPTGVVANYFPRSGSYEYLDGAVQAYDGITQAVATTPGETYTIAFWMAEGSDWATFSPISTDGDVTGTGGNGIDLLVYAGAIPTLVAEPTSIALLGAGLAGLARLRRRKG